MSEYIFVTNIFEYSNIRIYSSHSEWYHMIKLDMIITPLESPAHIMFPTAALFHMYIVVFVFDLLFVFDFAFVFHFPLVSFVFWTRSVLHHFVSWTGTQAQAGQGTQARSLFMLLKKLGRPSISICICICICHFILFSSHWIPAPCPYVTYLCWSLSPSQRSWGGIDMLD